VTAKTDDTAKTALFSFSSITCMVPGLSSTVLDAGTGILCPENSSLWPVSDRATTGTVTDRPEQGIFMRRGGEPGMENYYESSSR